MYRSSNPLEVNENIGISMEENKLFDENSQYVTAVLIILLTTIYLYTNSVVFVIINQIKNL